MSDSGQQEIVRLLLGYLNDSLTPEEEAKLNEWKISHEANMAVIETLGDQNYLLGLLLDDEIHQQETKPAIPFLGAIIKAAACIIAILGALYLFKTVAPLAV